MGTCERDSRPCTAEHLQGLFCTIFHDDCCRGAVDLDNTIGLGWTSGENRPAAAGPITGVPHLPRSQNSTHSSRKAQLAHFNDALIRQFI